MDNPFQLITDTFAPDYQINLSIQGLDGSIMLTLSNSGHVVAKRMSCPSCVGRFTTRLSKFRSPWMA